MAFLALARLTNRSLLRINGPDTYAYLQGLTCNDLRGLYEKDRLVERKHAKNTSNVLSTYMLNAQGRSICDLLIYRTAKTATNCEFLPPGKAEEPDELLIECDQLLASGLANTLFGYRVRRKIAIQIEKNLHVWSLFPMIAQEGKQVGFDQLLDDGYSNSLVKGIPCEETLCDDMIAVSDPRLTSLGMRIITTSDDFDHVKSRIKSLTNIEPQKANLSHYTTHRYNLGVGEGSLDHPESECLPLESNAEWLGSVSFSKGCYLGQELTARIHYTGVIRKRLMPIIIEDHDTSPGVTLPTKGADLVDPETEKKVGIIRNIHKDRGLGLIRTDLIPDSNQLNLLGSKTKIKTYVPYWWAGYESKNK